MDEPAGIARHWSRLLAAVLLVALVAALAALKIFGTQEDDRARTAEEKARRGLPTATATAPPPAGGLPDLAPRSATFVTHGSCTPIARTATKVVIANSGAGPAPSFRVAINGQQFDAEPIAAGAASELEFAAYRAGPNTIVVDAALAVPESDEGNNALVIDLPALAPPPPCTPTPAGR